MYSTENKEKYFEVYTYQVACPLCLPFSKISNCQSVVKYLGPGIQCFLKVKENLSLVLIFQHAILDAK